MKKFFSVTLIVLLESCASKVKQAPHAGTELAIPSFMDRPLHTKVSPLKSEVAGTLTCHRYSAGIIKVIDHHEKGAALSMLPATETNDFTCDQSPQPGEVVTKDWSGYFYGVKGDYAIFTADDGSVRGGMPFIVYRLSDMTPVFRDESVHEMFKTIALDSLGLKLEYTRVFSGQCDVIHKTASCINKISKATGVAKDFLKSCRESYETGLINLANNNCKFASPSEPNCPAIEKAKLKAQAQAQETVITYDVETTILTGDASPYIKRRSDALRCGFAL